MSFVTRLNAALALLATVAPYTTAVAPRHGGQDVGGGYGGGSGGYGGGNGGYGSGNGGYGGGQPPSQGGSSSCGKNEFWYSNKGCCLPHGGTPNPPQPPKGHQCPTNGYYWSSDKNCCVPNHPPPEGHHPTCPQDCTWNDGDNSCHPNPPKPPQNPPKPPQNPPKPPQGGSGNCDKNEFWYPNKGCCLPHGGTPNPPQPPKGHQCPTNGYYWNPDKKWCVPNHPPPDGHHPTCPHDCSWNDGDNSCHPNPPNPPQPSGHYGGHKYKRALKSRAVSLCPTGLEACPIAGLTTGSGDYECLDTKAELESCGGCTSLGKGQDCTAIVGAWNVGCEMGSCAVYTCAAGYRRSSDGKSCIAL